MAYTAQSLVLFQAKECDKFMNILYKKKYCDLWFLSLLRFRHQADPQHESDNKQKPHHEIYYPRKLHC